MARLMIFRSFRLNDCDPLIRIGTAVITRALQDAAGQTLTFTSTRGVLIADARAWLQSNDAIPFLDLAEIDPDQVKAWIDQGCPIRRKKKAVDAPPILSS